MRGRRLLAGAAAAATLLGAAAAAPSDPAAPSGGLEVAAAIEVGGVPSSIVATAGAIWVSTGRQGVGRIDPATNRIAVRIRPSGAVIGLAAGFGDLWAIDVVGSRLLRVDPRANRVLASLPVGAMPTAVAVGHGRVWVASQVESTVVAIDPRTSRVRASRRFSYGELWPGGLAVAPDGIWVVTAHGNELTRLDERTAAVERRVPVSEARTIAVAGRSIWVGRADDEPLVHMDAHGTPATAPAFGHPTDARGPALAGGRRLWVACRSRLTVLDPVDGAVELGLALPTAGHVGAVAVAGDVWVADDAARRVLRIRVG